MKFHRLTRMSLLTAAAALLLASMLMACGPADQSVQHEIGNLSNTSPQEDSNENPTATPEPTETPVPDQSGTENDDYESPYSKLDETLQEVVRQYEVDEVTEKQAAAVAFEFYRGTVLVHVVLTSDNDLDQIATNTPLVQAWFETNEIDPAWTDPFVENPTAYGYIPVSKLGAFSQQDYLHFLKTSEPHVIDGLTENTNADKALKSAANREKPTLSALTLKGYRDYDGDKEWKFALVLEVVEDAEDGEFSIDDYGNDTRCWVRDGKATVEVRVRNTSEHVTALQDWLTNNDISAPPDWAVYDRNEHVKGFVLSKIPLTKIRDMAQLDGVLEFVPNRCAINTAPTPPSRGDPRDGDNLASLEGNTWDSTASSGNEQWGTGTYKSQGVTAHNADDWYDSGYDGSGVRVGLIDIGLKGLTASVEGNELPDNDQSNRIQGKCYFDDVQIRITSPDLDVCNDYSNESHGVQMAETILDVAPNVDLYVTNAANTGGITLRERYKRVATWLRENEVDIINHSVTFGLDEGLANGYTHFNDDLLYSLYKAVSPDPTNSNDRGAFWSQAAGNYLPTMWGGAYRNNHYVTEKWHEFTVPGHERLWLVEDTFSSSPPYFRGGKELFIEMRWQDGYTNPNCDLDLYLKQAPTPSEEGINYRTSIRYQNGGVAQYPYEVISVTPAAGHYYYVAIKKVGECYGTDASWLQLAVWTLNEDLDEEVEIRYPSTEYHILVVSQGRTVRHSNSRRAVVAL